MKTLRLPEGWERDSGHGSVSNQSRTSIHSNLHPPPLSAQNCHAGSCNGISNNVRMAIAITTVTTAGTVSGIASPAQINKVVAQQQLNANVKNKKESQSKSRSICVTILYNNSITIYSCKIINSLSAKKVRLFDWIIQGLNIDNFIRIKIKLFSEKKLSSDSLRWSFMWDKTICTYANGPLMTLCVFSCVSLQADEKLQNRNILSFRIQYSITKMLLMISTVFILLNLPRYVLFI